MTTLTRPALPFPTVAATLAAFEEEDADPPWTDPPLPTFRPGPWQDMAPVTSRQDVLSGALLLFVLLCGAAAFFAGLACLIGIIWSFFVLG